MPFLYSALGNWGTVWKCGCCGMPIIRKTTKAGGKAYSYYICATNKATKECSPHSIATDKLESAVLEMLQKHI
ncbi:zinc ribbon domain-containing protein [Parablautia intestinalis]|uniref:zinc ribbon domain-containing protein n=1 Tax=Parablautia intestinalis TaxID=2320100 RepID=UPI00256EB162|nr:zinc ribbon domain-containing protein [Parablautia intestinalis]